MANIDVSLIVPVYGAEDFLRKSLEDIEAAISQIKDETWELVLVIDASPDRSAEICRAYAATPHPFAVKVLVNATNLGKGGAVRRGMLEAGGRYRIFNDCDLAYPMSEVLKVLATLKSGSDVAIASRTCPESLYVFSPDNFRYLYSRHLASRSLNFLISRFFLPKYRDTQAGLKGFTAEAAEFLFPQMRLSGFSFDMEILYLASNALLKIEEVPIRFYAQRVTTVNFFIEVPKMLRDIYLICLWSSRGKYSFSIPLAPIKGSIAEP